MKIVKQFILRKISGENVLVPVGETSRDFNGLITLNDAAAFIWKNIEKVESVDEMVALVLEEYDVDEELARKDAENFIGGLIKAGLIE